MAVEGAQRGEPAGDRGRREPRSPQPGEIALELFRRRPRKRLAEDGGQLREVTTVALDRARREARTRERKEAVEVGIGHGSDFAPSGPTPARRAWRNGARRRGVLEVVMQGRRERAYCTSTWATEDAAARSPARSGGTDAVSPSPPSSWGRPRSSAESRRQMTRTARAGSERQRHWDFA